MTRRSGQKTSPAAAAADEWTLVESRAAAQAVAKLRSDAPKTTGGAKGPGKGGGKGLAAKPVTHHGLRPQRVATKEDSPPGTLVFDETKPGWCDFTWRGQRYRCNTAFGGWTCTVCSMPTNRSDRTHCCCCGAKPKTDSTTFDKAPTSAYPAPQAAAGTGGASSTVSEEAEDIDLDKCAALSHTLPSLDDDLAALVWPTAQDSEPLAGKGRLPPAAKAQAELAEAQDALAKANGALRLLADGPKNVVTVLTAEVERHQKLVTAAQKTADAAASPEPPVDDRTPLQLLIAAQGRLSNCSGSHLAWRQAAQKRRATREEEMTEVANRYSALAAALLVEKETFLAKAKVCVEAWNTTNTAIDERMKAAVAATALEVDSLTLKKPEPVAGPAATAPAAPPEVATPTPPPAPAPLPPLRPLVVLPPMDLPEDEDFLRILASVRCTLHELHDQEEDVRSCYPVSYGQLIASGLTWDGLTTLLPPEIVGDTEPSGDTLIAWRLLGSLRRRLDGLAAMWDVKHAQLSTEATVVAAALTFTTSVMDQAKRVQQTKRTAPEAGLAHAPDTAAADVD